MTIRETGPGALVLTAEDEQALRNCLLAALRPTLFSSRLVVTPRRSGQIVAEIVNSYLRSVGDLGDSEAIYIFGQHLATQGLGHASILAIVEMLHRFALEMDEAYPGLTQRSFKYSCPLLAGYMAAREAYLLAQQEQTRLAVERAQLRALEERQ